MGDGEGPDADSVLVVIGEHFDTEAAEATLTTASIAVPQPCTGGNRSERLLHHVRLHTSY